MEINAGLETGGTFENRHAFLFGCTGIDRRLVNDDVSLLQCATDGPRCTQQRAEIGLVCAINRSRNRNDEKVGRGQITRLVSVFNPGGMQISHLDFARPVLTRRNSAIRSALMSNPMTRYPARPNATATGSPT